MRITHMLVPFVAWIEEIPNRAISDEVSNPNPKRMPNGYIFHGLYCTFQPHCLKSLPIGPWIKTYRSMSLNIFFSTWNKQPPPSTFHPSSSSPSLNVRTFLICLISLYRMYIFIIPRIIRNVALTELPMMPPTLPKALNLSETAAAVEATTMEVMTTIL
jgi:hypothetical protein